MTKISEAGNTVSTLADDDEFPVHDADAGNVAAKVSALTIATHARSKIDPPVQWLWGNWLKNGANLVSRPQVVPDSTWVPVHLAPGGTTSGPIDTTVGRPTEGTTTANVANAVTLTPTGRHTIEVAGGAIASMGLETPTTTVWQWITIEDTSTNTQQVVRYRGLSPGTGSGGNDQITGCSLGSWSLTAGTRYNVRQAACYLIDPVDTATALYGYYISNLQFNVGWEGDASATGWRKMRETTIFDFSPFGIYKYPAFMGPDFPGGNPDGGVQVCQMVSQPGFTASKGHPSFFEVFQSSGGDLEMRNGPTGTEDGDTLIGASFAAYTCVFQAFFMVQDPT